DMPNKPTPRHQPGSDPRRYPTDTPVGDGEHDRKTPPEGHSVDDHAGHHPEGALDGPADDDRVGRLAGEPSDLISEGNRMVDLRLPEQGGEPSGQETRH